MVDDNNKGNKKMNVNEMTLSEVFGHCMASRGITEENTMIEVVSAMVDTTRQATDEVAEVMNAVIYDFLDGASGEYMYYLTETPGRYISNRTGEVVSVPLLPHLS